MFEHTYIVYTYNLSIECSQGCLGMSYEWVRDFRGRCWGGCGKPGLSVHSRVSVPVQMTHDLHWAQGQPTNPLHEGCHLWSFIGLSFSGIHSLQSKMCGVEIQCSSKQSMSTLECKTHAEQHLNTNGLMPRLSLKKHILKNCNSYKKQCRLSHNRLMWSWARVNTEGRFCRHRLHIRD